MCQWNGVNLAQQSRHRSGTQPNALLIFSTRFRGDDALRLEEPQ
jgi:hypothetical protein